MPAVLKLLSNWSMFLFALRLWSSLVLRDLVECFFPDPPRPLRASSTNSFVRLGSVSARREGCLGSSLDQPLETLSTR